MDALDLSTSPPRQPRAELGGIIFLPRSIDKARAALSSDDDVVAFVRKHVTETQIDEWNAFAEAFQPRYGDRVEAQKSFTWLGERPDLTQALDILAEDDKRHYAAR